MLHVVSKYTCMDCMQKLWHGPNMHKESSKKCKIYKFYVNLVHFADSAQHTVCTEFYMCRIAEFCCTSQKYVYMLPNDVYEHNLTS